MFETFAQANTNLHSFLCSSNIIHKSQFFCFFLIFNFYLQVIPSHVTYEERRKTFHEEKRKAYILGKEKSVRMKKGEKRKCEKKCI